LTETANKWYKKSMKDIKTIFSAHEINAVVTVKGWVRTKRVSKNIVFIELYDGSCFNGIQCVFN
jgi:asparaginyl-tRNA synthetase